MLGGRGARSNSVLKRGRNSASGENTTGRSQVSLFLNKPTITSQPRLKHRHVPLRLLHASALPFLRGLFALLASLSLRLLQDNQAELDLRHLVATSKNVLNGCVFVFFSEVLLKSSCSSSFSK